IQTANREMMEELSYTASPLSLKPDVPFFITEVTTVGPTAGHTDVDLWYLMRGDSREALGGEDFEREFAGYRWYAPVEILSLALSTLDAHMHRFIYKLLGALEDGKLNS